MPTEGPPAGIGILEGENIICFAKDWNEDPTSCNHVLSALAKKNRVLWLNSISTRSPKLTSARDTGKIFRKIGSFLRGPQRMRDNLWQFTPLVLPFHQNPLVVRLNKLVLRLTLFLLRLRLGMHRFQLWTFVPTSAVYVDSLGADLIVYYCTDNWSGFSSVDGVAMGSMMEALARKADVVFATSHLLVDKLSDYNKNTHLAAHGVNYDLFAQAVDPATDLPADVSALAKPILGYYGLIEDWLDLDLISYLAQRHPEWSIVLLGRNMTDTSLLDKHENVHLLGRKPHTELPRYCKSFAVGLIPHKVNELTVHMNPIKLREYMCAGLSIVATDLPEVRYYPENCVAAASYAEFEAAVEKAVAIDNAALRVNRSAAMKSENWDNKVIILSQAVRKAIVAKRSVNRLNSASDSATSTPNRAT